MKRFFIAAALTAVLAAAGVSDASAQGRFGVMGGINFSKAEISSLNRGPMTKYHVGLTYQLKLPLGFAIQPALLYSVKGAKLGGIEYGDGAMVNDLSVGYLEVPVSVQWGPDLLLFRPFLDVTPYIGYGLHNKLSADFPNQDTQNLTNSWASSSLRRFEYGIGVGIGLEIWKFQVIGRYIWNLGSLYDLNTDIGSGINQAVRNAMSGRNFGGFTLTAALLF